ncbi:MAG: hypothetical protein KJO05_00675 [Bacteroidia bacterium]|nr:hypothetical protein [Bacteroidia bacterium]NNF31263.1 hypothetical protein [Flavobacteriaceae bacterium]MBT8275889.1 hypothetical protein [Bacteroidia bacterium]NNJ82948.1 hypothetical protein [Flavobacteriaceae bacterium]NNK54542.1 hypothetical protein [Flavobacteriaceae bacterium]
MRKTTYVLSLFILVFFAQGILAQVGIGTTSPKSMLDIPASNSTSPASTDGILIPRIDNFPSTNPGADQDGMLIFLRTAAPGNPKGFYYWDNTLTDWISYNDEWKDNFVTQSRGDYDGNLIYANQAGIGGVDVVVLDSGQIGMGTSNLEENLELKIDGDNDIQISSASPPDPPQLVFYTTNGSFGSPDFMNDEDDIGYMTGKVWTGTGKSLDVANIQMEADGNHNSGSLPTKIEFAVTNPGQTVLNSNNPEMVIASTGNVGIGINDPSAVLQLKAGSASSNSAPLKLTSGATLSAPETGAMEYDGTNLYFTPNTIRKVLMTGLVATQNLDFPNINSGNTSELTVTVTGASLGSSCSCAPNTSIELGLQWSCYVSAANTVTIRLSNVSGIAINPASKSWKVTVIQ